MPNFLSDQLTNSAAQPVAFNDSTTHAKVIRKYFSFSGTTVANADTIQLCKLPKQARITGGRLLTTAWGTSVTGAVGDGTTAAKYLAATSIAAASATDFANTVALAGSGSQGELAAEITLTLTIGGASPAAGTNSVYGFVDYLLT